MPLEAHRPDATLARLADTLAVLRAGLSRGLVIAAEVHGKHRWDPSADLHLFHHLARREAMAYLQDRDPRFEGEDNLGLPMSGLLLRPSATDVLRVWYSEDGQVRAPQTRKGRRFVTQPSAAGDLFDEFETSLPMMAPTCKTYVQWSAHGTEMTRFDLVRPLGVGGGLVMEDWRIGLLDRVAPVVTAPAERDSMSVQDDGD